MELLSNEMHYFLQKISPLRLTLEEYTQIEIPLTPLTSLLFTVSEYCLANNLNHRQAVITMYHANNQGLEPSEYFTLARLIHAYNSEFMMVQTT